MEVSVVVNGRTERRDVEPRLLLVHLLRDDLGLTGTHWGCDTSNCGACVVWLDDVPVKSCTVLAAMADGHTRCARWRGWSRHGGLDPVQRAFIDCHGLQCGFCTPAMLLTARWLLDHTPDPTDEEIRTAIAGITCRCTGYANIVQGDPAGGGARRTRSRPEAAMSFGRMPRKEDARFVRGRGRFVDDIALPGMLHAAVLRSPHAHAADRRRRHAGRRVPSARAGGAHRRAARRARPGLDAHALARRAGRARHGQGALPGPGGRVRRRRDPLRRPRRAGADRRGVRAPARRSSTPGTRWTPTPRASRQAATTTSSTGSPATPRPPTPCSPRRST